MPWHAMTKAFCRLRTQLIGIQHQLSRTYRWIFEKETVKSHFIRPRNGDSKGKRLVNTLKRPRASVSRCGFMIATKNSFSGFFKWQRDNLNDINIHSSLFALIISCHLTMARKLIRFISRRTTVAWEKHVRKFLCVIMLRLHTLTFDPPGFISSQRLINGF